MRKLKKQYDKYVTDEYAKDNQKTRIAIAAMPLRAKFNVPTHNTTFKLKDVLELLKNEVENVTPEMWTNFIGHVIKEEDKLWSIEYLTDEILDKEPDEGVRHILTIGTGDTRSSDLDSD